MARAGFGEDKGVLRYDEPDQTWHQVSHNTSADVMAADPARGIWVAELGYTVNSHVQPPVSEKEQADYLVGSFERVWREWPWAEMLAVWNLCHGRPLEDEMSGYSPAEPDLTPRPAYRALQNMDE
jgi:hypothetical protein